MTTITTSLSLSSDDPLERCWYPEAAMAVVVEDECEAEEGAVAVPLAPAAAPTTTITSAPSSLFCRPRQRDRRLSKTKQCAKDRGMDLTQILRRKMGFMDLLGAGSADPFGTLPELPKGDTALLTYHWHAVFVLTTTPPGPRKQWFPFAIRDPALFHATLLIAASHLAGMKRSKATHAFFVHRGEVIRLVSKRISSGQHASTDGTISAISMLLITDSMTGHPERTRAHVAGLHQLVSARGGIRKLHPLTRRLIGWVDLLASISLFQRPQFQPRQFEDPDLPLYYGLPSISTIDYAQAFQTRLFNFTGQKEASDLSARILWGLRNLSVLKETVNSVEGLGFETVPYSDRVELIERQVETLLHDSLQKMGQASSSAAAAAAAAKKLDPNLIFSIFAYACLIYVCFDFRDLMPSVLTVILAQRLEVTLDLDDSELNMLLGTFPELMLWVLFLGGRATKKTSRVWFARTASRILRVQKLEDEKSVTAASVSFLWPEGRENYDESTCKDIEIKGLTPPEIDSGFVSATPNSPSL